MGIILPRQQTIPTFGGSRFLLRGISANLPFISTNGPSSPNMLVDFWQDFQFAGAVNQANLEAQDHASLTWTVADGSSRFSTSTSAEYINPSTINGLSDSSATLGLASDITGANTEARYLYASVSQGSNPISVGFWFFLPILPVSLTAQEIFSIFAGSALCIVKVQTDGLGNQSFRLTGTTDVDSATVPSGAWYWINLYAQQNSTCKLRIYNTSGALQGAEKTVTGLNQTALLILVGSVNSLLPMNATLYYDDLVADWTNALYPLTPF